MAYQIVLSEILPRISYLTHLWVGALDRRGETAVGDRIDRRCRWIFPAGLLLKRATSRPRQTAAASRTTESGR